MIIGNSENNSVRMGGAVASDLEVSHEVYGEKFYRFYLDVERLSGQSDHIPIIISERLIDVEDFNQGKLVELEGQFRSYNQYIEGKSKLMLSVFVKTISTLEVPETVKTLNEVSLNGFICKPAIYRKTPLGREIADILIAVNRAYNKSDYIPCILWGRNAKYCENIAVGTNVAVVGRVQSRPYEKKDVEGNITNHMAYEISVSKFEISSEESTEQINEDEKVYQEIEKDNNENENDITVE